MKGTFLKDVRERDKVEGVFLVCKKEIPISKSGKPYLNLRLMDRTGEIEGRVWEEAVELSRCFEKDDFVKVRAWAVPYQGGVQLNISSIERCPEEDVSIEDFLPSTERDIAEMMGELTALIDGMKNRYLKELLKLFISDEKIRDLLKRAPAAKSMHHAYLGGLLEHTVSLSRLVLSVAKHYRKVTLSSGRGLSQTGRGIDEDLLLTGAILHDIGKIYELSYDKSFGYTDEGRLLGHITIGVEMVEERIARIPNFPRELAALVKHMILSHHGYLEYGSPKRPKTLEAVLLYYIDDMDSKMQSIQSLIDKEEGTESRWTTYHKLYDRYIYKGGISFEADQDRPYLEHEEGGSDIKESPAKEGEKPRKELIEEDLFANIKRKSEIRNPKSEIS